MRRPLLTLLLTSAVLAGCGADERRDATTTGQHVDRSAAEVIAMPDRFRNVADKCDGHGHRVYSNSTGNSGGASQIFVINDPSCGR
jgi:nitrous oxide reductase accessory protein NosL